MIDLQPDRVEAARLRSPEITFQTSTPGASTARISPST